MTPLTMEEAVRFHGHAGPWLILGYRAGLRALEVLGDVGIRCSVKLPIRTPYTCLVDGIQASSGCTLGKQLIELLECDKHDILITFAADDGRRLELRLRREVVDLIERLLSSTGVEGAARVAEGWGLRDLFEERLYP